MQPSNTQSELAPLFIPFPLQSVQSEANDSLKAKIFEANADLQKCFIAKETMNTLKQQAFLDEQRHNWELDHKIDEAVFAERLAAAKADETRKRLEKEAGMLEQSKNIALLKQKEQEALWAAERAAQGVTVEKAAAERKTALTQIREQSEHAARMKEVAFDAQEREEIIRIAQKKRQVKLDLDSDVERTNAEKAIKLLKVKRYRFALTQAHKEYDAQYQLALSKLDREEAEIITTTQFEQEETFHQAMLKAFSGGGGEEK